MTRTLALTAALLAALAVPSVPRADSQSLMVKRQNSCGSNTFEPTFNSGAQDGYRHKQFGIEGRTYVAEAVLEWCQTAQNAVIYFYVDDPGRKDHEACPESMSFAVFPGRGSEAEQIIKSNLPSYDNPRVTVIEKARAGPVKIPVMNRTIDAYQLEAVIVDSAGANRRQKMIGYEKDGNFIRIMTGVVDDKNCKNDVTAGFMSTLRWP
jgi:hypothetical protein